jgi:hypothetical protein
MPAATMNPALPLQCKDSVASGFAEESVTKAVRPFFAYLVSSIIVEHNGSQS